MRVLHRILGLIAAMAMIIVLLITSFEIAAYSNFDWYLKEYLKYEVLDDLEMEAGDVMHVTKEMMSYLRGNREDLVVETIVDGNAREFFNDREKAHMVDVKNLFLGGLDLRLGAGVVLVGALIIIVFTKAEWKKLLPQSFLIGVGGFIGLLGIFACLIAKDFHKYFFLFHEIFFDNDLWLLDPATDLMIRMLPEGFFFDMVIRISTVFAILLVGMLLISIVTLIKQRNKKNL